MLFVVYSEHKVLTHMVFTHTGFAHVQYLWACICTLYCVRGHVSDHYARNVFIKILFGPVQRRLCTALFIPNQLAFNAVIVVARHCVKFFFAFFISRSNAIAVAQ